MKQTIYIDVLIAINLFINYFLLLAVSKFLSIPVKRPRLFAAAAFGAAASLTIFMPEINLFLSLLIKLVLSVAIVRIAFRFCGLKQLLRQLAAFYIMSFAFAGLMLAFWYFIAPQGLIIKNSIVYFNISPLMLIIMTVICYFIIRLINRATGRQAPENLFCKIQIDYNGESVSCLAKVDTGNTLTEPFSNAPVAVVYEECVAALIPQEDSGKIRFVPFQAISGGGLLPAFKPDKLTIFCGKNQIEINEVYIAVTKSKLGAFTALLNPDLLQKTSV